MMIILKLGGSIITEKGAENPSVNQKNLSRIAREIKNAQVKNLIIVHGAGSFGHPFASEYQIGKPINGDQDLHNKKIGFSLTQSWVKKLNNVVCDSLRDQDIPAVSIQPSSFVITKNKRIESANLDLINHYLENGFVPVIYGDVVLDRDESIKMAVLSGDQIINYLSKNLIPERVILGTDVDGVYTKNPKKHSDAKLIEKVTSLEELESLDSTTNIDVTGGMIGKLKELLELASLGIESEIINAGMDNLIESALKGEKVSGTLIIVKKSP
jgi:isopentenyl phosphate kinase